MGEKEFHWWTMGGGGGADGAVDGMVGGGGVTARQELCFALVEALCANDMGTRPVRGGGGGGQMSEG